MKLIKKRREVREKCNFTNILMLIIIFDIKNNALSITFVNTKLNLPDLSVANIII